MIGKALADHGATVVRIESPGRLDLLRTMGPFKDNIPGPNRTQFYANFNTSKLGMTLDLKTPGGRELAQRMAGWADVVLENFSPGTMARFGIDYETLSARRGDLVMLSTCMRGQTGPERTYSGFGNQGAAVAGMFSWSAGRTARRSVRGAPTPTSSRRGSASPPSPPHCCTASGPARASTSTSRRSRPASGSSNP